MCGGTGASTAHHSEASNRYFAILKKYSVWSVIYTVYIPRYILCLFRDIYCVYSVIFTVSFPWYAVYIPWYILCLFRDILYTVYIPWYILCLFRDIYCVYSVIYTMYIPWYILCIFRYKHCVYSVRKLCIFRDIYSYCVYSVIYTAYIPWYILCISSIQCFSRADYTDILQPSDVYTFILNILSFCPANRLPTNPTSPRCALPFRKREQPGKRRMRMSTWGHEDMEDKEDKALSSRF